MNEMLALMDGYKPCLLFERVFLEQMPDDIRLLLADGDFAEPRQLAARADVLWHAKQQDEAAVNNVAAVTRRFARTTSAYIDGAPVTSLVNTTNKDKWFYYHKRWGSEARRCRPPCTYLGNALTGRR